MAATPPVLSVVVPLFDEAENLERLHEELTASLSGLGLSYELLLVDDGSTDGTLEGLLALESQDPHVRVLRLRRNFGQTAATTRSP